MKELNEDQIKQLEKHGNIINIHDEYYGDFKFYFIWQGESTEAIFYKNTFIMYVDIDEYLPFDTFDDEKEAITKEIRYCMEEADFMYYLFEIIRGEE